MKHFPLSVIKFKMDVHETFGLDHIVICVLCDL